MLQDNKDYLETIDMGKQINGIIDEGIVYEKSLLKYRKDALKLYIKQRPKSTSFFYYATRVRNTPKRTAGRP